MKYADVVADVQERAQIPSVLQADLATRLYEVNQDLALAYESWEDLPRAGRRDILIQARWIADLLARLEGKP